MVIGTTGFDPASHAAIVEASKRIPVLKSANMSVGVNVLLRIVGQVVQARANPTTSKIVEAHHRSQEGRPCSARRWNGVKSSPTRPGGWCRRT